MNSHKYKIIKEKDQVTLLPSLGKVHQTLIFLHGWGQSGPEWVDYFIQGTATPKVKFPCFLFSFYRTQKSSSRLLPKDTLSFTEEKEMHGVTFTH